MLETLLVGVGLYASTNIDDIFLTMAFFADRRLSRSAIVAGKFVGIFGLALASWAAAAFSLVISPEWIALLGFVPLGLGIHGIWASRKASAEDDGEGDGIDKAPSAMLAQIGSVAGVTAANGGDNLGVYVPVFAKDFSVVPIYLAVFAVMTVVWCVVGRALVTHRLVAGTMQRLARVLLPYVLILLGLWILPDAIGLVMPADAPPAPIEESN
jgi:cadmium resistance protein CadD (predicted permease)